MSAPLTSSRTHHSNAGSKRKFDPSSNAPSSSSSSSSSHDSKRHKSDGFHSKSPSWKKGVSVGGSKSSSKSLVLTRADRVAKKKERKSHKPNADLIAEANKVWQTSFTLMEPTERSRQIEALLGQMSGKMQEIGLKHDASRAIQLAIKYASEAQKLTILKELTGNLKKLSEEHYGHYIVIKLMSNDTKKNDAKKACLKEFRTHINKLSVQPDSAKVLDYLYASSSKKDQNIILQEFYSPEFVVFGEDENTKEKSLGEIIQLKPEKKNQILDNLRKYLDKSLEKNMIMFRFIHSLLLQYISHASSLTGVDQDSKDFLTNLFQFIPALHHSTDGCRVICHLLSVFTSAKDRKAILKYFKGLVGNMADRPEGVWVITTALDVVDDTVLLDKTIFAELIPLLKEHIAHPNSSRIYLHILNPTDSSVFAKEEQANYSVSARWILNSELAQSLTKDGMLSKKDPQVKRLELLSLCLLPILTELSTRPELVGNALRETIGNHLLTEVIRESWRLKHDTEAQAAATAAAVASSTDAGVGGKKGKKGKNAAKIEGDDDVKMEDGEGESAATSGAVNTVSKFPVALAKKLPQLDQQLNFLFDSIASECSAGVGISQGERGEKLNAMEDRFGHYALKRLISLDPVPDRFIHKLMETIQPNLLQLATTNRPAFVLSSIIEKKIPVFADELKKKLKPFLKDIIQASNSTPTTAPMKDESSVTNKFTKKNAPVYNLHSTTNAGVDLLAKLIQGLPTEKAASTMTNGKKGESKVKSESNANDSMDVEEESKPVAPKTPAKSAKTLKKATTAKKSAKKKATNGEMED